MFVEVGRLLPAVSGSVSKETAMNVPTSMRMIIKMGAVSKIQCCGIKPCRLDLNINPLCYELAGKIAINESLCCASK